MTVDLSAGRLPVGTAVLVTPRRFSESDNRPVRAPYRAVVIDNESAYPGAERFNGWYQVKDANGKRFDALVDIVSAS